MFLVPSRAHLVVALVAAAATAVVVDLFLGLKWPAYAMSVISSTATLLILLHVLKVLDDRLAKRVLSTDGGEWLVRINDVTVGRLSEQLHATIQREALHDPALATAQLLNVLKFPLAFANVALGAIPAGCFWVAVGAFAFYPKEVQLLLGQITDMAALSLLLRTAFAPFAMLLVTVGGLMVAFGYRFGLRNVYSEFVASTIRRICESPAEGELTLWREARLHGLRQRARDEAASTAQSAG